MTTLQQLREVIEKAEDTGFMIDGIRLPTREAILFVRSLPVSFIPFGICPGPLPHPGQCMGVLRIDGAPDAGITVTRMTEAEENRERVIRGG